jgi:hypothetical protein
MQLTKVLVDAIQGDEGIAGGLNSHVMNLAKKCFKMRQLTLTSVDRDSTDTCFAGIWQQAVVGNPTPQRTGPAGTAAAPIRASLGQ